MNAPAISIRGLSKCYKLGAIGRHTLVDEVTHYWHKLRGRDPRQYMGRIGHTATEARRFASEQTGAQEFWALRDITVDIPAGAVVGVIGRNGAGKSTLLKILTRITTPTCGEAMVNGRVGSLLEVGTGFHPELTGRENIFMNGAILGMKKTEISRKFEEIVAFAEVEKFLDTPVKRYSSGMYVRLAFAVAAHLDPEILLVDEVLAVGDAAFQRKCLGKMESVAEGGRTVIFVSHQMGAIAQLCRSVVVLRDGQVRASGATEEMIGLYLKEGASAADHTYTRPATAAPATDPCVRSARTTDISGHERVEFDLKDGVTLDMDLDVPSLPEDATLCVSVRDQLDRRVFTVEKLLAQFGRDCGTRRMAVSVPPKLLTPGHYSFMVVLHVPRRRYLDLLHSICRFTVVDTGSHLSGYAGQDCGPVFVDCVWERRS